MPENAKKSPEPPAVAAAILLAVTCAASPVVAQDKGSDEAVRISGFVDGTVAHTTADPSHWSRGVTRLQVSAQGKLGELARWKIGGRADIDPLIANSGFYLDAVKRDLRDDFFWRETYVDFTAGDWEFRLGAQNIVWGEVVGLFFADVVSARDLREFLLPAFDLIRQPQWAARGEYFFGDSKLELVWIPAPTFDRIGKPGGDFYPAPLPSPTPQAVADQFLDPLKPERDLDNGNYGVRFGSLIEGWDLAAFYYRSFDTSPTFYRMADGKFQPRYDRIWQIGSTLSKDLGQAVLRAEAVYAGGRSFSVSDPAAPQGVVARNTLDWVISAEMPLESIDGRVNVQVFQRLHFGGGADAFIVDTGSFGASLLISAKLTPSLEPSLLWMQGFGGAGSMVRPRLAWSAARNLSLAVAVDIFGGSANGYFGRFGNRDRVALEARYSF
jgi:hypothetical protein